MKFIEQRQAELLRIFKVKIIRSRIVALRIYCLLFYTSLTPAFSAVEFFAAPNGSASGDGSIEQPWNLRTALNHPTNVAGGDTIWLRGGVYRRNNQPTLFTSSLNGEPFNPITVRQYPGERATIDGNIIQTSGGWVDYQGFEIMNTHSNRITTETGSFPTNFTVTNGNQTQNLCVSGFDLRAPNVKLINLIIHDSIGGGVGVNRDAINSELHGILSFYNGWQGCDRAHGHGYYGQNLDPSFAIILNSLFFANYAIGIQATSNEGAVDNFYFDGNALFFNGVLARKRQANFLLGPASAPANSPTLFDNFIYDAHGSSSDVNIGYLGGANNPALFGNYFQTAVHFSPSNQNLVALNNVFLGGTRFLDETNFPDNDYSTNRPTANHVQVRPNSYEPGRAHIIVYNWEGLSNVTIDASSLLSIGTDFEVRNAQDFFGAPVLTGTYLGDVLDLPMHNLRVTKPIGTNAPPSTAPEFNLFVLLARETSPAGVANSAPLLSPVNHQFTAANTPTASIPFTFSDAETPTDCLTISIHSSHPDLVPNPNIHFQGSGTNRSFTIVPALNESGTTIITLAISDGFLSVSNVFSVTVSPTNDFSRDAIDTPSIVLTVEGDNTASLHLAGPPDTEYEVEASTNLTWWKYIGTIAIDCTGVGHLQDPVSSNYPTRFYRFVNHVTEHED